LETLLSSEVPLTPPKLVVRNATKRDDRRQFCALNSPLPGSVIFFPEPGNETLGYKGRLNSHLKNVFETPSPLTYDSKVTTMDSTGQFDQYLVRGNFLHRLTTRANATHFCVACRVRGHNIQKNNCKQTKNILHRPSSQIFKISAAFKTTRKSSCIGE
jgi:hypothetical protein